MNTQSSGKKIFSPLRLGLVGAAVAVVLIGADTILWYKAEQLGEAHLNKAITDLRHKGWTINMGARHRYGWPLKAGLAYDTLEGSRTAGLRPPFQEVKFNAQNVRSEIGLLHPRTCYVTGINQSASVTLQGREALLLAHTIDVTNKSFILRLPIDVTRSEQGKLDGASTGMTTRLHMENGATDEAYAESAIFSRQWDKKADRTQVADAAALKLLNVSAPGLSVLGTVMQQANIKIARTGPYIASYIPDKEQRQQEAARWAQQGGSFLVQEASFNYGPLTVNLQGKIQLANPGDTGPLDPAKVQGHMTLNITGLRATLNAFAAQHIIPEQVATSAESIAKLLNKSSAGKASAGDDALAHVSIPIDIGDRDIRISGLSLRQLANLAGAFGAAQKHDPDE